MNVAYLQSLSNSDLARYVRYLDSMSEDVAQELQRRFVLFVDMNIIHDEENEETSREIESKEAEIDDLRAAISEAISVLESV